MKTTNKQPREFCDKMYESCFFTQQPAHIYGKLDNETDSENDAESDLFTFSIEHTSRMLKKTSLNKCLGLTQCCHLRF